LVTDINLKGSMNGWRVAREAREIDAQLMVQVVDIHAVEV
jgi:hypothetical protein